MTWSGLSIAAPNVVISTRVQGKHPSVLRAGLGMWKRCQMDQVSNLKKNHLQNPQKNGDKELAAVPEEAPPLLLISTSFEARSRIPIHIIIQLLLCKRCSQ